MVLYRDKSVQFKNIQGYNFTVARVPLSTWKGAGPPILKFENILFAEVFRAAAEASPSDILKLYNTKGNLVNISAKLAENTPDTRYQLDVIAAHLNGMSSFHNN